MTGAGELLQAAREAIDVSAQRARRRGVLAGQHAAEEIEGDPIGDRAPPPGDADRPVDVAQIGCTGTATVDVGAVDRQRRRVEHQRAAQAVERKVARAAVGLGDARQRVREQIQVGLRARRS